MIPIKRILVPVDFSEPSDAAVRYARSFASAFDASIDVLHVIAYPYVAAGAEMYVPPPVTYLEELDRQARTRLEATLSPADRTRFDARLILRRGNPSAEIVQYAAEEAVDLIVMGTHGRTGFAHVVLGSVAERVVRRAPCPVLTVHGAIAPAVTPAPTEFAVVAE